MGTMIRTTLSLSRCTLCLFISFCAVLPCLYPGHADAQTILGKTTNAKAATIAESYGRLTLNFEENQGQAAAAVRFLSRNYGSELYFTGTEAVLELSQRASGNPVLKAQGEALAGRSSPRTIDILRMQLQGMNQHAQVIGQDELPGKVNYFLGKDPAHWHSNVATYAKVRYKAVYPGIDLVYYGNQRQLEYDFVLDPGADSNAIRLHLSGAKRLRIASNGDLVVQTENSEVKFEKPVVYQDVNGARLRVESHFALLDSHTAGFRLGRYDHFKSLVIDPTLVYATYLGGSTGESGNAIAVDSAGDVYVTGQTLSSDFPVTSGAFQTTNSAVTQSGFSAFVSKFNPSGSALLYSTYLDGTTSTVSGVAANPVSVGVGIALDSIGDAYVTGSTNAADFPATPGAPQSGAGSSGGNFSLTGFVTKLNPSGSALIYSTCLGGAGSQASAIAVDASGDAYVTGGSVTVGFVTTPGSFQPVLPNPQEGNAWLVKLNPNGTGLLYSTFLNGSTGNSDATAIAVDAAGDAYVTGFTGSTDFPVTPGAFQTAKPGLDNAFVLKLNPSGSALIYSTYLGGNDAEFPGGMAVDSSGDAYVTGGTSSTNFPTTTGVLQTTYQGTQQVGGADAFVTKLNPTGTALIYSTYIGGSVNNNCATSRYDLGNYGDNGQGIAVDSAGNAYVSGLSCNSAFPTTPDAISTTGGIFLAEINPDASALVYSTKLPSGFSPNKVGSSTALARDNAGNVYITGITFSGSGPGSLPTTTGAFQTTAPNTAFGTAFVAKFSFESSLTCSITAVTSSQNPQSAGSNVTFTANVSVCQLAISGGPAERGVSSPTPDASSLTGTVAFSMNTTSLGSSVLDSNGNATISTTALPIGSDTVTAFYAGNSTTSPSSANLTETILGQPASIAVVSGSGQTSVQGTTFANPLVVLVTDTNNNPLPGVTVTFSGSGASFSNSGAATTNSAGEAQVTATPTASGSLTVTAGVSGLTSTARFSLNATASTAPVAVLTPASLVFGPQASGTASAAQSISLSNTGNAALNIAGSGIGIAGANAADFSQSNQCGSSVAAGGSCAISVTFMPSLSAGSETAILSVPDNASGSPQQVQLSGIALPPPSVSCTVPMITLSGDAGTGQIVCTATDFTGTVSLSCNLPATLSTYVSCNFNPSTLTFTSSTTQVSSALTIQPLRTANLKRKGLTDTLPGTVVSLGALLWLPAWFLGLRRKRGKSQRVSLLLMVLLCYLHMVTACSGGSGKGSNTPLLAPSGTYQASIVLKGTGLNDTITFSIQVP